MATTAVLVEVWIVVVAVLEGPAAGAHIGPHLGPVALHVQHLQGLQPLQRVLEPAASGLSGRPASISAWAARAVSHTGDTQGWQ